MKNLAHSASFDSDEKYAPSKPGIKHLGNVLLDTLVGSVPILGSIFDVYFKANNRNVRLLRRHLNKYSGQAPATRPA
ncbi:DUF4112 domain-containing protein, partial [Mesorhizobium sp. LNJC391B00]|uniref:DUF4112 domain-containing protein n=1 Tax=Mesorhizobium sp. LNJC391B00 TaxID=1287273 RepID=UPI0003CEE5E5